jgi:hypothetical protein
MGAPASPEFGSEQERLAGYAIVERLLAKAIPREQELPLLAIPEGDREHPVEALERRHEAPLLDRGEKDLGVGLASKMRAPLDQLGPQFSIVVDLTVVRDGEPPTRRGHRLVAERRQVENRQPAMAEGNAAAFVDPCPGIIGTAVRDRRSHPENLGLELAGSGARIVDESSDSAHGWLPLLPVGHGCQKSLGFLGGFRQCYSRTKEAFNSSPFPVMVSNEFTIDLTRYRTLLFSRRLRSFSSADDAVTALTSTRSTLCTQPSYNSPR